MHFARKDEIKIGDRLVRPIYSKEGVLLYGSGTKVDSIVMERLNSLNIYGLYVLDVAEPVPPITPTELEFERFQTIYAGVVDDMLLAVMNQGVPLGLQTLIEIIMKTYGTLQERQMFTQCVRTKKDFISKHSLNVAILSAMIMNAMKLDMKERPYIIEAAIFHDIGKLLAPKELINREDSLTREEMYTIYQSLFEGFNLLRTNYAYPAGVRRYMIQLSNDLSNRLPAHPNYDQTLLPGTKILQVADIYDTLTAIRPYKAPISAFSAFRIIRESPDKYDSNVVDALESCLHVLPSGSYVKLTNGEQGIVVRENFKNLSRPVVLGFQTNNMYDLEKKDVYEKIQIADTIFTADNRQAVQRDFVYNQDN